jgi:hypothetical protein
MNSHDLKSWPEYFEPVQKQLKTFELRKNDRNYQVGDTLILREWDPASKTYTGRTVSRRVTYILPHLPEAGCAATFGLMADHVIMSLEEAR